MKLTRAQRETVRAKFGGRCAYCGCDLPERWHVDHVEPVERRVPYEPGDADRSPRKPERHTLANLYPACPQCNISKGAMSVEGWRVWLAGHVRSLNRDHSIYRLAKSFGLVQETGAPVVFYFEVTG